MLSLPLPYKAPLYPRYSLSRRRLQSRNPRNLDFPSFSLLSKSPNRKTTLNKKVFAAALQLPFHEVTFDHPTPHQLETMIFKMGYIYKLPKLFQLSKGHISPLWQCLIHYIIKCLTGYEIDYAKILFEDFLSYIPNSQKPKGKIHSARFCAMCIEHIYQTLQIPISTPRSKDDILVMPEVKPYAPKTDTVFGKLRKLPDSHLNVADPTEPALLSHLSETKDVSPYAPHPLRDCTSEPSSKDSESKKLEERQNSPDSEDTQEEINMVEKQNSPSKDKRKEKVIETPKDTASVTLILDRTQPPVNATEFDVWKFRTAINEQATLVERLKQQFELRNIELQTLSELGPPFDADSEAVTRIGRRAINNKRK
ncbi:hypothetical protein L2E82_35250 [Cichorium intybus]|uniref:Uncharacterized protein n=1 Tax=Cichorium intybus TaxID=13427 RepID=A0ACB9BNF7_CICIN|nr:hypothetical protein L2E82_35250 [Cichorium intybus]